jgi:hypothetical protein
VQVGDRRVSAVERAKGLRRAASARKKDDGDADRAAHAHDAGRNTQIAAGSCPLARTAT